MEVWYRGVMDSPRVEGRKIVKRTNIKNIKGGKRVGMNWEIGNDMCGLPCVK